MNRKTKPIASMEAGELLVALQREHKARLAAHLAAARTSVQTRKPSIKMRWTTILRRHRRALERFLQARSERDSRPQERAQDA
jgi:hypothetical protein